MNVRFVAPLPREKARPLLDEILKHGSDQIAVACAFLTGGGVELLRPHVARLRSPDSFVVVAWEEPTQLNAVEDLYNLCPGHVYVHLGDQTPREIKVGSGLMHSKVFLSRAGDECWLWTGSHNLTASAAQGVNCEAAVVLDGWFHERPFQDALAHLMRCRDEAVLFDPFNPPKSPPKRDTLIIHAERDASLRPLAWFVHLRPPTTAYDPLLTLGLPVWLYLHPPGTLHRVSPPPVAEAAFSGTVTAVNYTEYHPKTRGIPAEWEGSDYVIEETGGVFHLTPPTAHTNPPTQCVFRLDKAEDPNTKWVSDIPQPRQERVIGDVWTSQMDPGFKQFFTAESVGAQGLIHRPYRELRRSVRLSREEVGTRETSDLAMRLNLPQGTEIHFSDERSRRNLSPLIYRGKYRR